MRYEVKIGLDAYINQTYTDWYKNGKLHRLYGPAVVYTNNGKEWFKDGQFHRKDGPAIEWPNGYKAWWIENKEYSEEEFNHRIKL